MGALIHHVLPVLPNAFPGFPLAPKLSPLAEGSIALENAGGERHGRHFSRQQVVVWRLERSFGWLYALDLISPSQLQPMRHKYTTLAR